MPPNRHHGPIRTQMRRAYRFVPTRAWASDNASASGTSGASAAAWNRLTATTIQSASTAKYDNAAVAARTAENRELGTEDMETVGEASGKRTE